MRLSCVVVTLVFTVAVAYYVYVPLPAAINEQWKLMLLDAGFRFNMQVAGVVQALGLAHSMVVIRGFTGGMEDVAELLGGASGAAPSAARISDTLFAGVPVRVYEPPADGGGEEGGQLRRAVLFFHGGGWALGSAKRGSYHALARQLSDDLNAVVVSVEYRLAPEVLFPQPYEDCLAAAKHFLSQGVLGSYSVDPQRVAVSGDSAGGNLAAAVAQQISVDDSAAVKFRVQALIYPALQALDFNTPSYRQNRAVPVLYRRLMARFWLQYLGADPALLPRLLANEHSAPGQPIITPDLRARLNWTALLAPRHRKQYRPVVAAAVGVGPGAGPGRALAEEIPGLLDARAAPLLAEPEVLSRAPRAYVLTCEHDVLRDDGLMYARRLRDAGVEVAGDHYDDGFHGCLTFAAYFDVGRRARAAYVGWLRENL